MEQLDGRVAVITGAGSGIGQAMAVAFAAEGMRVAVLDIDSDGAQETGELVRAGGDDALVLTCDVSVREQVRACADAVFDHFGAVHVLCNNAGVTTFKPVTEMTDGDWDWMVSVDLMSVVYGYQAYLPRMLAQGVPGHVVNTSSGIGVAPDMLPDHTGYAMVKAGMVGLSSSLRVELAGSGIGVSVLCPGMVRTRILESLRTRPERFGGSSDQVEDVPGRPDPLDGAVDPMLVGKAVVEAIKADRQFIFPQPEIRDAVVGYYERMIADFG